PDQFSNRYTFSTVGGEQFSVHYLQVFADNTETDTITLDGLPIGASHFTAIGSSGYSVANIPLTEGSHTTASDLGHGIFVMGLNSADSYLYAGGARLGIIEENDAPVASDVNVSGAPVVDGTLTASYTYSDAEADHEGDTSLQWLRADDAQGTNKAVISGATDNTYTPTSGDIDKFISVEVTPVAQTGTTVGKPVESRFVGPVSEEVIEYGELQFDTANYSVKENAGPATIVVTRENGSDGDVCVNYTTANGSATAPSDYTSSSDTVCWKDGETVAKPLKVKIIDDVDVEGNETFKMSLSNATGGATIGSPSAAVVTIVDNDIESECLHATYFTANRKLVIPLLDIPLLDPLTEEPTGGIAVFNGDLNLINGVEDFKVIPDSMAFIEMLEGDNECHATYSYADRTIHIPFVDVPSVMVLPPNVVVPGPTQVFDATMQQLPLSDDVFHLKGYEYLYTIED
ncbi:MAG: Calx-beta domain-containing protein, partial [Candidatus Parabeggiatoa sp.]|nr:Calx-beta domain-containing protein [Candidatus Parabeggiatoa sp.]